MPDFNINIAHLFPDLLNLYGDRGNITCLAKRLLWRNINVEITEINSADEFDSQMYDIIFLGGGSDREQALVCNLLLKYKDDLHTYVDNNGVFVAVCGGYQLLGKYYKTADKTIEGLGILDCTTESSPNRLIGNIIIENDEIGTIVGFENHAGRTAINGHTPMGKVTTGHGNDGISGCEGIIYKNIYATYLHGPLLPKNPNLCDKILFSALLNKYENFSSDDFPDLDDELEKSAHTEIIKILK